MNITYAKLPPQLDIDTQMATNHGWKMDARQFVERVIFFNLLEFLATKGFAVYKTYDGEDETNVSSIKEAMELAFNLDEVTVYVRFDNGKIRAAHSIYFVFGNDGTDVIADWSYITNDIDGFNVAISDFTNQIPDSVGKMMIAMFNEHVYTIKSN